MPESTTKNPTVAELCLYGNRDTGAGWIAQLPTGVMLGNGDPVEGRSFTEAVWLACDEIRSRSMLVKTVRIFAPGGERVTEVRVDRHIPAYGDLKWGPAAPAIVINFVTEEYHHVAPEPVEEPPYCDRCGGYHSPNDCPDLH